MNARLEYIADCIIIEKLASVNGIIVIAQDGGIMSSIAFGIKDYISSIFERFQKNPIASVMAFMGPGLLLATGLPWWIATIYEIAGALGFDWTGFWSETGSKITEFVKDIVSSGKPADESAASSTINQAVSAGVNSSFTGQMDKDKLTEIAKRRIFSSSLEDAMKLKKIAIEYNRTKTFKKVAGIVSSLTGFLIRIISWVVKTALMSLGIVSAAGAMRGLLGINKDNAPLAGGNSSSNENASSTNQPIRSLQMANNVPSEIFTVHPNDMSSVWMEHGDINNIEHILISWVLSVYPQLKDYADRIKSSSNFQTIVSRFEDRNKLSSGTGMISIPRPYQRIADIVSPIVNGFLSQNNISINDNTNQSPGTNI